jgi:hypothetical protein
MKGISFDLDRLGRSFVLFCAGPLWRPIDFTAFAPFPAERAPIFCSLGTGE